MLDRYGDSGLYVDDSIRLSFSDNKKLLPFSGKQSPKSKEDNLRESTNGNGLNNTKLEINMDANVMPAF